MMNLKPLISQNLTGQIWKLHIDPNASLLFAESRDIENKQALFYSFDIDNNMMCFSGLTQPEKWLTGIEGSYNGILLLHGYQSAQSPVHKGITAIDGRTGHILWNDYNLSVHHITTNGPVAFNTQLQPPRLFLADVQNGAALRSYNPSTDQDIDPEIKLPYTSENTDNELISLIKGEIIGNIDYIEYNSFRIVSLHSLFEGGLSQILLILAGKDLVYYDLLNDKIQKLQPEAFMMHRNKLIYIKNKTGLRVLNL